MRFRIFEHIVSVEEDMPLCNLAHLFNGYMDRLHSLEVAAYPQETLGEFHRLTVAPSDWRIKRSPADREKAEVLRAAQEQFYLLSVVNSSLHDLHLCVVGACNALGEFFTSFDGDLHRYAVENRLRRIAEFVPGTEDELAEAMHPADLADYLANWEPGEPGGPWKLIHKEDAESLAPYTLLAEIGHYFAPLCEYRTIERIGSTLPDEWDYFTEVVRECSANHLKTSQLPEAAGVYRKNAAGEYEQQSVAQRVENELNDGMKDRRVAGWFQQIMHRLQYVAGLSVMLTDAASYRELSDELLTIRDCTGLRDTAAAIA
ncbi:hypothetical protein [Hymenobacter negativus]|uniref:Uncharacterized protein n=1 Tax=Hymenobacter negativus TaxID=2795026 RepID=A0ABS3QD76_9BACT|nr:hypothetical protein [Hymenobacter negativus]MBO2009200.1 hypothetical protein [Hymenobacter negativus]